jgi:hypothetical protein
MIYLDTAVFDPSAHRPRTSDEEAAAVGRIGGANKGTPMDAIGGAPLEHG